MGHSMPHQSPGVLVLPSHSGGWKTDPNHRCSSPTPDVDRLSSQRSDQSGSWHDDQFLKTCTQRFRLAERKPQGTQRRGEAVLMAHDERVPHD
ncbi:hypothetical protein AAFF_G00278430 [Aldrovandia affinis]|uniref:Uncharacterized protein n=1 Tax=Aldrovandia affinis TaxID=143900 RepID=A0AAD7SR17_9TELE|nr:hypothetical protein AAFF_G00278430 [Aldrovandia affinis]